MSRQHEKYGVYWALLHLYPKQHRQAYGEQMVQTLDDMLSEQQTSYKRFAVWLKIFIELPLNIIEENIRTIGGLDMSKLTKASAKQYASTAVLLLLAGSYVLLAVGLIAQRHQNKMLSDSIDAVSQNQHATSGGTYYASSISPSDHAVYLPLAKLKLADTKLNEQLVYTYQEARP